MQYLCSNLNGNSANVYLTYNQFWSSKQGQNYRVKVLNTSLRNFLEQSKKLMRTFLNIFPGSTPLSIGCTSPIFCSRVRCLNPTSIGLPMSILMSRCKTSKWVRLTAVFKRLKFKQKDKKETFLGGRDTTFFGVVLQRFTHYTTLYCFSNVFGSRALN